jgi:hypothetical protein
VAQGARPRTSVTLITPKDRRRTKGQCKRRRGVCHLQTVASGEDGLGNHHGIEEPTWDLLSMEASCVLGQEPTEYIRGTGAWIWRPPWGVMENRLYGP